LAEDVGFVAEADVSFEPELVEEGFFIDEVVDVSFDVEVGPPV